MGGLSQLADVAQEGHVGRGPRWGGRRAEVLQSLEGLVAAEAREPGHPVEFERRFGYPGEWEPLRIPDPEGRELVFVRGAIDRSDRADDRSLLVSDYKSSRKQSLVRKLDPGWLLRPEFQRARYGALVRQHRHAGRLRIEHHAGVSTAQEAPHHVAAHPAEADHSELHYDTSSRRMRATRRPRSCNDVKSPAACARISLPKPNGWPGIASSSPVSSTTCR